RGQRAAVIGTVPSRAQRAQLLEQLAEAVKDIDFRRRVARGDADDVPGVVVAVVVGRKVRRVVDHPDIEGHAATAVDVPDGDGMVARGHVLKDVAVLERAVVQLVLVGTVAGGNDLNDMVARKGTVDQVRLIRERRRRYGHRGANTVRARRGK